jgi:PII-like signaling protein
VIEIVDSVEKIREFPPVLDTMMTGGLVTLGEVHILKHGAKEDRPRIGSNERTKTVV